MINPFAAAQEQLAQHAKRQRLQQLIQQMQGDMGGNPVQQGGPVPGDRGMSLVEQLIGSGAAQTQGVRDTTAMGMKTAGAYGDQADAMEANRMRAQAMAAQAGTPKQPLDSLAMNQGGRLGAMQAALDRRKAYGAGASVPGNRSLVSEFVGTPMEERRAHLRGTKKSPRMPAESFGKYRPSNYESSNRVSDGTVVLSDEYEKTKNKGGVHLKGTDPNYLKLSGGEVDNKEEYKKFVHDRTRGMRDKLIKQRAEAGSALRAGLDGDESRYNELADRHIDDPAALARINKAYSIGRRQRSEAETARRAALTPEERRTEDVHKFQTEIERQRNRTALEEARIRAEAIKQANATGPKFERDLTPTQRISLTKTRNDKTQPIEVRNAASAELGLPPVEAEELEPPKNAANVVGQGALQVGDATAKKTKAEGASEIEAQEAGNKAVAVTIFKQFSSGRITPEAALAEFDRIEKLSPTPKGVVSPKEQYKKMLKEWRKRHRLKLNKLRSFTPRDLYNRQHTVDDAGRSTRGANSIENFYE